jgi:hypothetical protein
VHAVLPWADSEDGDVVIGTDAAQPAVHFASGPGFAHAPLSNQEPASKRTRTRYGKREATALEEIPPISTAAEQQLFQQLVFPGSGGLLNPSSVPAKLPDFSKLAMKFNEQVVAQRAQHGLQVSTFETLQHARTATTKLSMSAEHCALLTDVMCPVDQSTQQRAQWETLKGNAHLHML